VIGESVTASMMQRALDGVWQRQKAIAGNIANQETPGYKAVKVSFEKELENQVKLLKTSAFTSSENQKNIFTIQNSTISFLSDSATSERADGNNVNVEAENIDMAKTQIQYQYLTRGMSDMYSRLRYAISEGRK
jgi:flagellar basal-body rod protein FlgB